MFLAGVIAGAARRSPASDNWPQWRGDGSAASDETHLPVAWSETQNVLWRTPLSGDGNSSPIIWGKQVFLTTSLDDGARRLVLCLDSGHGKILWQTEIPADAKTTYFPKTGFASPTPVTDGHRVYAFFDSPGLVALDMQGKIVWTAHLGPFKGPYNMGSSPVLFEDLVIQCCDNHGQAFIVALEQATGKERWRTPRLSSSCGHFGTPLLIHVQGHWQVVVNGEPVQAYDPSTGKEIWSCHGMREVVAPSPVFGHGLLYASSGRVGPVLAIDPTGTGDVTETHVRWRLTDVGPYVPTPLVCQQQLLVPGDNGKLVFCDPAGKLVLEDQVRDHFTSSPVTAGGKIYWPSERGRTYVIDAAGLSAEKPSVHVLAVNQLHGICLATPAIASGRLFIRTTDALYCLAEMGKSSIAGSAPVGPGAVASAGTTAAPTESFDELKARYEQHRAIWQNEPEARIRFEAMEAIARLDDPRVIPFLLRTVQKEPHFDICEEAAKSLGRKGEAAVDSLIVLAPDSRPFIRTIAIKELARLKAVKAIPAILSQTRDKQALVRSVCLQALAQLGRLDKADPSPVIAAMLAALDESRQEDAAVKQAAVDGLGALAGKVTTQRPDIVRTLSRLQNDRNPALAKKARELLASGYEKSVM